MRCVRFASGVLAYLCAVLAVSGCATVTGGARDPKVTVTSDPPGAAVTVDGQPRGVTPAVVEMSRKSDHQVEVIGPGCEPICVHVERRLNPWVFGNIIVGGLIGVVVDVAADSTHRLTPGEIHVNLRKPGQPDTVRAADPDAKDGSK